MTPFAGKTLKTIDYSTHWQNIVGLVDSGTSGDFPVNIAPPLPYPPRQMPAIVPVGTRDYC